MPVQERRPDDRRAKANPGGHVFDFAVIGGGIVGLSAATALLERHPGARLLVLEQEQGWSLQQTAPNSGDLHSGIYYKPGTLRARYLR